MSQSPIDPRLDQALSRFAPLLTSRDLQKIFGVGEKPVYRFLDEGMVPAYRLGRRWFILRDQLRDAIAAGRMGSGADLSVALGHQRLDEFLAEQPMTIGIPEAAQLLGVQASTVRAWVADGDLPATQIGRRWMILTESLRAALVDGANHSHSS